MDDLERRLELETQARLSAEAQLHEKELEILKNLKVIEKLKHSRDGALKSADAKNQFMANMSHEIRTPLNHMFGMLEMLSDSELSNEQIKQLKTAQQSSRALLDIVNDIFDFSKLVSGEFHIEEAPTRLITLFDDALSSFKYDATSKGIDLQSSYPKNFPEIILVDDLRIRQIIMQLVSNAIKFTPQGRVSVELVRNDKHYELIVEDSGIGMSNHQLDRIYASFDQLDVSNTRQFGGTGLGLSITNQLVDKMGGSIKVQSQEGKGSTFTVLLPLTIIQSDVTVPPPVTNKNLSFKPARVLIVEDNDINQEVVQYLLSKIGLLSDVCVNGLEAIQRMLKEPDSYSLILMDIQMPMMDGLEATRQIRMLNTQGQSIPIIAMTAHATDHHRQHSLNAGMNEHITKPINSDMLIRVLGDYLETVSPDTTNEKSAAASIKPSIPENKSGTTPYLDIPDGIKRLKGNKQLYLKLIESFMSAQKKGLNSIDSSIESKDFKTAQSLLHTLKGSAANISAIALSASAARFEEHLKKGNESELLGYQSELSKIWIDTHKTIDSLLTEAKDIEPKTTKKCELNDKDVLVLFENIRDEVDQNIAAVEEIIQKFSSQRYTGQYLNYIERISEQLQSFDIEAMKETLALLFTEVQSDE